MVGELVAQQAGPVRAEEVEGHLDLGLGLQATGAQGQVDELQQAAALWEGRLSPRQPLAQVKLGGEGGEGRMTEEHRLLHG